MKARRLKPLSGRKPTREELLDFRGANVDDLLPEPSDPVKLLFAGINPGLWTAAVNAHFARPGNRFWPALQRAGITREQMDVSLGMRTEDRDELLALGIGITNLVPFATAKAEELTKVEVQEGGERLRELVRGRRPKVVAVLGLTAYRQAFGAKGVSTGRQGATFEEAELWVLPNPSGLNAHETVDSLAHWYRQAADAAEVETR